MTSQTSTTTDSNCRSQLISAIRADNPELALHHLQVCNKLETSDLVNQQFDPSTRSEKTQLKQLRKVDDLFLGLLKARKHTTTHPATIATAVLLVSSRVGSSCVVTRFLKPDINADPAYDQQYAIRWASGNGHTEIVRVLLADERVNPPSHALSMACENNHLEVVKLLITDPRIDPSVNNELIRVATDMGYIKIITLLMADQRVDPSAKNQAALMRAIKMGRSDVVNLLLTDSRVNPAVKNQVALVKATRAGYVDIVNISI